MECDRVVGEDRPHQAWDGEPCSRRVGGERTQCLVELLDGCCHPGSRVHRCLLDGAQLWRGRGDGLAGAAVPELGVAVGSHRKQDQTGEQCAGAREARQQPGGSGLVDRWGRRFRRRRRVGLRHSCAGRVDLRGGLHLRWDDDFWYLVLRCPGLAAAMRGVGDRDRPAGLDQVGVRQVCPVVLDRVARCLEQVRVAQRVTQLRLSDLGERVPGLHLVLLDRLVGGRGVRFVRDLEHSASDDEVGAPVEHLAIQLDDLGVAPTLAEHAFGNPPQAVAPFDRVVGDRRRWSCRDTGRGGR